MIVGMAKSPAEAGCPTESDQCFSATLKVVTWLDQCCATARYQLQHVLAALVSGIFVSVTCEARTIFSRHVAIASNPNLQDLQPNMQFVGGGRGTLAKIGR